MRIPVAPLMIITTALARPDGGDDDSPTSQVAPSLPLPTQQPTPTQLPPSAPRVRITPSSVTPSRTIAPVVTSVRETQVAEPTVNSPPRPTVIAAPSQLEVAVTSTSAYSSQETTISKMKEEQLEQQKQAGDNMVLVILTSCLGAMVLIMGTIMGYNYYRKRQGQESFVWFFDKKLPPISPLQSIYSSIHFPGSTIISTDSKPSFMQRRNPHDPYDDQTSLVYNQVRESYMTIGPDSSVSQKGRDTKLYSGIEPLKDALVRPPRVASTLSFSTSQLQNPASNYMDPKYGMIERPFSFEHTPTDLVGTFIELPYSSCDEDMQHEVIPVPRELSDTNKQ
jgi:hypothetical protein